MRLVEAIDRITQMRGQLELMDKEDPNFVAIISSIDELSVAGVLNGEMLYGDVGLAYIAGRLRGRQEWTIQMGENDEVL